MSLNTCFVCLKVFRVVDCVDHCEERCESVSFFVMRLKLRRIIADIVIMLLTALLTPVYLAVYALRVVLRAVDKSEPIRAKHVLITGATSGLGKCLAERYVKTCETLLLVGRSEEKLDKVKSECKKINSRCVVKTVVGDMNKGEEYRKVMEECSKNELVDDSEVM